MELQYHERAELGLNRVTPMAINRSLQDWPEELIYELDVLPETVLTFQHLTKRETLNEKNLNHKIAA